jgi:hypothetical protein
MCKWAGLGLGFAFLVVSSSAIAAESGGGYRSMNLTLPIVSFGGEAVTKAEWNIKGRGALGLELNLMSENEMYTEKEMEEKNGDSLLMKGSQLSLQYSQYGNPKRLSGGYWAIGIGYRQVKADWQETPNSLTDLGGVSLNSEGKLRHSLSGSGPTAQARVGYRYVADSIPFSAGAYIGLRHFQNKMKDVELESGVVKTRLEDLGALERRTMSQLEPGIELGLAF